MPAPTLTPEQKARVDAGLCGCGCEQALEQGRCYAPGSAHRQRAYRERRRALATIPRAERARRAAQDRLDQVQAELDQVTRELDRLQNRRRRLTAHRAELLEAVNGQTRIPGSSRETIRRKARRVEGDDVEARLQDVGDIVGVLPDDAVASRAGVSQATVRRFRRRAGRTSAHAQPVTAGELLRRVTAYGHADATPPAAAEELVRLGMVRWDSARRGLVPAGSAWEVVRDAELQSGGAALTGAQFDEALGRWRERWAGPDR